MSFAWSDMSGDPAALFIDEAPKAFGHHQGSGSKLDDLDFPAGNQEVKCTATDPSEATGIIDAHANRFNPEVARCSIVD